MSAALDDLMLRSIGAADDQQANERFDMLIRSSSYVSFRQLMSSRVHGVMDMNRRPVTRGFDYRSDFRISGYLVVRPHSINPANRQLRQRAIDLIRTTTLAVGLWDLMQQTRQRGLEYGANILGDGTLEQWPGPSSPLTVSASRPSANTIGQVHTHPSGPTLQPPSVVDFIRNDGYVPVQLVVESCSGRLWALFWPRYTALLGRLTQTGFQMLNPVDSRAELMFEILGAWEWRQAQEAEQEQERRQRAREFHQGRR